MYIPFSKNGVVDQKGYEHAPLHLEESMPVFVMGGDLSGNVGNDAHTISDHAAVGQADFLTFRSVLKDVQYYADVNNELTIQLPEFGWEFCNPDLFSYLARQNLGGQNHYLATYLFDTIPATLTQDITYTVKIAVRNDGWDTWTSDGAVQYRLGVEISPDDEFHSPVYVSLPRDVPPGDSIVLETDVTAPSATGNFYLRYEMGTDTTEWFSDTGDAPWLNKVTVTKNIPAKNFIFFY